MELKEARPVISVFGSHNPRPGDALYEEARELGRMLAESGFTVATGGYEGVMAAASRGAFEAGGHTIGVTSRQVEQSRGAMVNPWVRQECAYTSLNDRLLHLVSHNQGMIALAGGIGTLNEVALAWNLLQVKELPPRPLILMGQPWPAFLEAFVRPEFVSQEHLDLVELVDTPPQAIKYLQMSGDKI